MTDAPSIGLRIKRARERRRWTQRQLADALGVNVKSVDNWEAGRTSPRNSTGAIEEVLGISLDEAPGPEPPPWNVPLDQWEADTLAHPDMDDETKRELITASRAGRAASAARRAGQAGRRAG